MVVRESELRTAEKFFKPPFAEGSHECSNCRLSTLAQKQMNQRLEKVRVKQACVLMKFAGWYPATTTE